SSGPPARFSGASPSGPPLCAWLLARAHLVELLDAHQHRASLRPLARADDAAPLEQVHQPARAREADAQLALEHARGPEPGPYHEAHRLAEQLVRVAVQTVTAACRGMA